jgi:hypothetical protein
LFNVSWPEEMPPLQEFEPSYDPLIDDPDTDAVPDADAEHE